MTAIRIEYWDNWKVAREKINTIIDEVNANNEDIEQQSYSYKSEIEDFFERIYTTFGVRIHVIDMNEQFKETEDEIDEKEEEDEYVESMDQN